MNDLSIGQRPITCSAARSKAPARQNATEVASTRRLLLASDQALEQFVMPSS